MVWSESRRGWLTTSALGMSLVLGGCGGGAAGGPGADGPPPPAPTFTLTRALTGPDGVQVEIAEYGTDQALFRFTGVRSPAAGFAFDGVVEDSGRRMTYRTQWDGDDYYPIHRESARGGEPRWRLYAPGLSEPVALTYDEARSNALDGDALWAVHIAQTRDGSLPAAQAFDRPATVARHEEELASDVASVGEECGTAPEWAVQWETIGDEVLLDYSVSGYCENVLDAMRNLCRWAPGRKLVQEHIDRVTCAWGDEWSLTMGEGDRAGTLAFVVASEATNLQQRAREALMALEVDGIPLSQAIAYAQTDVCKSPDGRHVVVVHPHTRETTLGISYGTREELFHSPQPYLLGRGWFFDPRQFNPQHNVSFRGADLRYYSYVEVDDDEGTCQVVCGERTTDWTLLPDDDVRPLLEAAEEKPTPFDRTPYALARDRRGNYYYVDRGNTEASSMDFRVYRGPRGRMRQLEMRDVVSDSEGEIFSTASGDLRLIVDDEGAQWIRGRRTQDLRRVPVQENYRVIMEDLGVYLGTRLEVPCDDY